MNPIHPAALIAALALSPLVALAAPAPEPMRFTSQSIQMPTSDRSSPTGRGPRRSITTASPATRPGWC